ncbi:MAG: DUF4112 domain-containing protein [Pseudomonadota bacterium]
MASTSTQSLNASDVASGANAPAEDDRRLARLDRLSKTLDSSFRLPILNIPVGWDAILGLIPGVGALVTLGPGVLMVSEVARRGGRRRVMARMVGNTAVDMAIGSVPVLGDVVDVFFKSHRRNVALLKTEADRLSREEERN